MIVGLTRSATGSTTVIPYRFARITPPATEPLTLQQAKAQCRVVTDDENEAISDLIRAARSLCESEPSLDSGGTGRACLTQTWDLILHRFPNWGRGEAWSVGDGVLVSGGVAPVRIPKPPLQSVTSVTYVDPDGVVQVWNPSLYTVETPSGDEAEPGSIAPVNGEGYPPTRTQPGAVTIRFVAGYGSTAAAVPAALTHGMKLLIGHWWVNRPAVGERADVLPFGVDALWQSFRVL